VSPEPRRWALACLVLFLVHLATVPGQWQVEGVDEIEYLGLAHSLITGQGYTLYGEPHVYYPPAYPAVLAGALRLAPVEAWRVFYGLNALLGFAALVGFGYYLRLREGEAGRWASWLILVSYYGWSFGTRFLLSEPLFLLCSLGALACANDLLLGRGGWGRWAGLAAGALGASATRSASIALAAALVAAGGLAWLRGWRRPPADPARAAGRRGLAVAVCAAGLMLGFNLAWQIRADRVNPQAAESYLRWAKRILLGSSDTVSGGVVDRNQGEGIEPGRNTWPHRVGLLTDRLGQTVLSLPRVPETFRPVAVFCGLLVLVGAVRSLRARPDHPLVLYLLVALLLFSLTSWASSYLRYLYTVLPLLILLAVRGLRALVAERARRPVAAVFAALGLWSVGESVGWSVRGEPGAVSVWTALGLAAVGVFGVILCVLAAVWWRRRFRADPAPPPARALTLVWTVLLLQFLVLVALRVRRTESGRALEATYLHHAFAGARWIRENTPPETPVVTTYPELVGYLTQRPVRRPTDCREPVADPRAVTLGLGILSYVPGVAWMEEECLRQSLKLAEAQGTATPLFRAGLAGVYRAATNARDFPLEPGSSSP
jgi:hypothetical protein